GRPSLLLQVRLGDELVAVHSPRGGRGCDAAHLPGEATYLHTGRRRPVAPRQCHARALAALEDSVPPPILRLSIEAELADALQSRRTLHSQHSCQLRNVADIAPLTGSVP